MKKLNLAKAFQLTCGCQSTATVLDPTQITWIEGPDDVLAPSLRATLVTHYSEVLEFCRTFELPVSEASCVEIIKLLDSEQTSKGRWLHSPTRELVKRIQVELQSKLFLYVPSQNGPFYQEPLAGWEKTTSAFPSAIFDIQEASKCLALQGNTACVFHLMRVMGSGLTSLGKSLNEPTLDASHNLTWNNVLSRCTKELSEKFSGKSPEWQSNKEFYAKATHTLLAVKDAWRNPNAHEVGGQYTDEETSDIYAAIRSFVRHLATKLKETP